MTVSDDGTGRTPAAPDSDPSGATDGGAGRQDEVVTTETAAAPDAGPAPEATRPEVAATQAPPADPVAAAAAVAPRRGGGFAVFVALIALLVALAALAATLRPDLLRHIPGIATARAPSASLAPLEKRLAALEALPAEFKALGEQVTALAARPVAEPVAPDTETPARLAALEERLSAFETDATRLAEEVGQAVATAENERDALAERLAATSDAVTQAAPAAALSALDERLATLEKVETGTSQGQAVALALAAASLRRAVVEGTALAQPLALARKFAADDAAIAPALATLDAAATNGIPSEAVLRGELAAIANAVHVAMRDAPGTSWGKRTLSRIEDALSLRRPATTGSGQEAMLARAQAYLANGDVAGASTTLASYSGAGSAAVAAWRARAASRVAVLAAVTAIETRAYERMAAGQ